MGVGPLYVVIRVASAGMAPRSALSFNHSTALSRGGSTGDVRPPRARVYGEYGAHVTLSTATHRSAALLPKAKRTNP